MSACRQLESMTIEELERLSENSRHMVETVRGMSNDVLDCLAAIINAEMARRWRLLMGVTPCVDDEE